MTAFEILLNKLYDTIEENEPKSTPEVTQFNSKDLFPTIRSFVDISFSHGHKLSYRNILSELIENAANSLQNTTHEEWTKVKFTFIENDLHTIRRDRNQHDVHNLKSILDRTF